MVLRKLTLYIYSLIGFGGRPRIKQSLSYEGTITSSDVFDKVKVGVSSSLTGSSASVAGGDNEGEFCCVCLSGFQEGGDMRVLPCLHRFHKVCVDRWLNGCRKTCPVCRFSMGKEEKLHHQHSREELTEEMVIWFSSFHVAGF